MLLFIFAFLLLWPSSVNAAGAVPAVGADMGCSSSGNLVYYNGTVLTCANPTLPSPTISGHLIYTGSAPGIAAGTGAGTTPTVSISGVDNGGSITITTGTFPTGSAATIATITYVTAFPSASVVTLLPGNATAAALSGSGSIFVPLGGTSSFLLKSGITGLVGGTTYIWNYTVIGW